MAGLKLSDIYGPNYNKKQTSSTDEITSTITTPYADVRNQIGASPTYSTDTPTYSQSAADQLRRSQAWDAIQQGRENAGLSAAEIQAMKNNIANRMSSESSSAERLAREAAARSGTAGGGSSDRRLQELAAMNQARASSELGAIEANALENQKARELEYAGLGASTASQFGQDELGYASLGEQALMNRLALQEQARQANLGASTDLYRWQNENELLNKYRAQERSEYQPILDEILGRNRTNYGRNVSGLRSPTASFG